MLNCFEYQKLIHYWVVWLWALEIQIQRKQENQLGKFSKNIKTPCVHKLPLTRELYVKLDFSYFDIIILFCYWYSQILVHRRRPWPGVGSTSPQFHCKPVSIQGNISIKYLYSQEARRICQNLFSYYLLCNPRNVFPP